ncbi:MAG TPA: IclR family transcriptional regulator [Propionibacteriaceae bacterium]
MVSETSTPTAVAQQPRVVQSVVHASGLLKALHKAGRPSTLSDLARKIGLSKPATYALLKTLEVSGLITRDAAARYQLSWGLYELGSAVIRPLELARIARLPLDNLARTTGEAVLLGILDNSGVLYLDRGQDNASFTMVANTGRRSPLHTNASGKVLLAYQDPGYIDAVASAPLHATTSLTITDANTLKQELTRVRERGYATCGQEQEIGLSSIAVPVFNRRKTVAALAVAGPTTRLSPGALPGILAALQAASTNISRQLA